VERGARPTCASTSPSAKTRCTARSRERRGARLGPRQMSQTLQPHMETMRAIGVAPDQAVPACSTSTRAPQGLAPTEAGNGARDHALVPDPARAVFNTSPCRRIRGCALQQQLQATSSSSSRGSNSSRQQQKKRPHGPRSRRLRRTRHTWKRSGPHGPAAHQRSGGEPPRRLRPGRVGEPRNAQVVLAQQTAAASKVQRVASARNAGSSISGAPGGVVPTQQTVETEPARRARRPTSARPNPESRS
jgi:hypothetical protein